MPKKTDAAKSPEVIDKFVPTLTLTSDNFKNLDGINIKERISISAEATVKSISVDKDGTINVSCEINSGSVDASDTKTIKKIDEAKTMDELEEAGKKLKGEEE